MTRRGATAAGRVAVRTCGWVVFESVVFEEPPQPTRINTGANAAAAAPILALVVDSVLIAGFSRAGGIAPWSPATTKDADRPHFFPSRGGEGFTAQGVLPRTESDEQPERIDERTLRGPPRDTTGDISDDDSHTDIHPATCSPDAGGAGTDRRRLRGLLQLELVLALIHRFESRGPSRSGLAVVRIRRRGNTAEQRRRW